jgi:DNA-binding CsgD family transcriptional regulator
MHVKLRSTGIMFAGIFLASYFVNLFFGLTRGDAIVPTFFHPYQIVLLASVALFALSAYSDSLRWIQPSIFVALSPLAIISDAQSIYGLGFFVIGVLLLERSGFFFRHRLVKAAILLAYLLAIEVAAVILSNRPLADAVSPTFFIAAFGVFLWFLYKDKLVVILKEPKQRISLETKGLSSSESLYIRSTIKGRHQKEIAADFEVSESTIRNTLARAYKKLGIEDKASLAGLAERFDVVE